MRACRGYGLHLRFSDSSRTERFWESLPERVKAPYTKGELTEQDPEYHETRGTLWKRGGPPPQAKYYLVTDSA